MLKKIAFITIILSFQILAQEKSIKDTIINDYKNFYTLNNIIKLGGAFAIGGTMANTSIDQKIQNWYKDNIKSNSTDNFAKIAKSMGDGTYLIPLGLLASSYYYLEKDSYITNWGLKVSRSYLVGAPFMLTTQFLTGGSRPSDKHTNNSYWRPFKDNNGVSGHAFMGTVPFVVIAKMSNNYFIKIPAYLASFLTAWSRVNDNAHYTSQVLLGWYIGYLSVESVFDSDKNYTKGFKISSSISSDNTPLIVLNYTW